MTKEQLEKANSLKDKIDSIESFLRVHSIKIMFIWGLGLTQAAIKVKK